MSEHLINKANKRNFSLRRILIGALVVVTMAAIGVIANKFISYKSSGGIPTGETAFAQVAISSPPQGVQLEVSESVMVEAAAIGSNPFASMELWINGELLGVQAAPSGGVYPFSTFFSWRPVEPGIYSLIAEAIDIDGNKEISEQVMVFVVQTETGIELLSSDSPSVLPAPAGGGYSPPAGPGASESTGPAEIWSPSVRDWVTSLTVEVKPAAPALFASAGECATILEINDLSDNEEGFAVYRQTGISPMWVKVASLSSQSEWPWITYADAGIYGAVNYYVTAFNSKGESKSNIVMVSIDPTGCATEGEKRTASTVEVALQVPNLKAEKVYCYMSTDGMNWARWPLLGFLKPDGIDVGGPIMTSYNVGGEGQEEGEPTPAMDLFMECWGWEGSELQYLGKLGKEGISPQENGSQNILGEGIMAEVDFEISKLPSLGDFYPMGLENQWIGDFQMKPVQMGLLSATSPEVPRVYLNVTTDREICGQHLPPDAQNFIGQLLYCFPYPAYDPDKGGATDQPYLVWDFDFFEPTCIGGVSDECKTYWELLDLAEENGGQVGFTIMSLRGGIKSVWNVTEPDLTMFVVPPLPCIGDTEFSVRMWYRPGKEGVGVAASPGDQISEIGEFSLSHAEILYGPYSNLVTIPCNSSNIPNLSLIEQVQFLEIELQSVDFSDLDDGLYVDLSDDTEVELYGYFRVKAPAMGHWETEHCFHPWSGGCDDEPYWAGTRRYLLVADWESEDNLLHVAQGINSQGLLEVGYVNFESEDLCLSTTKYSCSYKGQSTSYEAKNNTFRVFVKEGDALTFDVMLVDYDELFEDDLVCVGTKMTPSRSLSEWGDIDANYVIHGETTDSGSCRVDITVKAVWGGSSYESGP